MKNSCVFKSITELMDIIDLKNKNKITSLQIKILMYIMKVKKCQAAEISKNLKISRPTCSRILSKMGTKNSDRRANPELGLINQDYDYESLSHLGYYDRRNKIITLTKKGELLADKIASIDFTGGKV